MENENYNQEEVLVKQKSSLHQVTPLSKYLAMVLFIILPFLGGYVGYVYSPEKVIGIERVLEVEPVNSFDLNDNKNLVAQNNLLQVGEIVNFPDPEENSYYVSEPELVAQGYLDASSKGSAPYFDYYAENVVKVDDTHTILAISTNPAGFTNSYLIDETQKEVVRELETGRRNIGAVSDWYSVEEGGVETTYQLVALDDRILLVDYVNDVEKVIYAEDDPNISLLEICELGGCEGYIEHTLSGNVRVSRFSKNSSIDAVFLRKYIDTIEITLPDEYKQRWLRSEANNISGGR